MLGGTADGGVTLVLPLPNLIGSRAFLVDPFAQYTAERTLKRRGLILLAVYHSHPGGGAQLSPEDLAFAMDRPFLQIVIALAHEQRAGEEARAYRVSGGASVSVPLLIA